MPDLEAAKACAREILLASITEEDILAGVLQSPDSYLARVACKLSEFEGKELNEKIKSYMNKSGIKFSELEGFLSLYPDKIYRNMYKVGVLNGIST